MTRSVVSAAGRHARLPGLRLPQQGRAAAAGRDCPLSALAAGTQHHGSPRRRPEQNMPLGRRSGRSVRRHGLQDRGRSVRAVDLRAHLPGPHREGPDVLQPADRANATGSAASCGCTPTNARRSTSAEAGDIVAVMGIDCASGDTYAARARLLLAGEHVRARTGDPDGRRVRRIAPTRIDWARHWPASARKIPRSASTPTRKRTRS